MREMMLVTVEVQLGREKRTLAGNTMNGVIKPDSCYK